MTVTATLATGIAQAAPWGIALDGLLAAELHARIKANRRAAGHFDPPALDVADPVDLDLPLTRCDAGDGLWHWAATCAHPTRPTQPYDRPHDQPHTTAIEEDLPPDVHYWTGRTDPRHLEQLTTAMPTVVSNRKGRYRARRMPLLVTVCTTVTWRAVGDPDAVRDLLTDVTAIGKKRSQGEGQVLRWDITADPTLDPWDAAHLYPDGRLGRPTPTSCLVDHPEVTGGGYGTAGLRPPYMHPARQHLVQLPALLDT